MPLNAERDLLPLSNTVISRDQLEFTEEPDTRRMVSAALAENRLRCAFQPIVSAARPKVVSFYECLARIVERNGDIVPAGRFIPSVETTDLGRLVDRAILREALTVLQNNRRVRLSVNLSAKGLGDQGWLDILQQVERESPGVCDFLIVEITETALLDISPGVISFLEALRKLGCSVALDDFGAGHTSISHLTKFRFDFLKIDGSFVMGISENKDNQFLVRSMVSIARHFEMVCVAEMVGSDKDADVLRSMGVDCLQGYHFGVPQMELPAFQPQRSAAQ